MTSFESGTVTRHQLPIFLFLFRIQECFQVEIFTILTSCYIKIQLLEKNWTFWHFVAMYNTHQLLYSLITAAQWYLLVIISIIQSFCSVQIAEFLGGLTMVTKLINTSCSECLLAVLFDLLANSKMHRCYSQ